MNQYLDEQKYIKVDKKDVNVKEVFKTIGYYKWSIIIITLLSIVIASIFLYFQPSIYNSYAIIKIKTNSEPNRKNMILNSVLGSETTDVKEDITLLKTFYMNDQALNLNRVNFQVQYYTTKYKERELYSEKIPIIVTDIEILDREFLGKKLTLVPKKDGFTLQFKPSFTEKLKSKLLRRSLLKIKGKQPFAYKEIISTKYFRLKVDKLSNFNRPIDIIINGKHRYVYEKIIKKNLKITQLEEDVSIIKISYKDNIQKRAIAYIDSLTDSFVRESIKNKNEQNNKVLEFIIQELGRMKEKLKRSEKKLEEYRISNEVIQPSVQATTFIRELSDIDIKLSENQLRQSLVQNLIKFVERNYNLDAIAPTLMEFDDKPTLELITILQESELKRDELLSVFTSKHPEVKAMQNKINTARTKIISNIKNLQKHILQKSNNLNSLKAEYEDKLKTLPTKERKLINIKRDYEVSSKMYNFLLEKQAENEIVKVATLSDYKVIDKAYSGPEPVSPKYSIVLIASIILGLITGVIFAFIRDALNDNIKGRGDIENQTNFSIYGTIPFLKQDRVRLEVYDNPNSYLTESYRTLRTNLQLSLNQENNESKVILITSTIAEEGKNITTANLSAIFQMANYRVVTIDLDMRTPSVSKLFNINNISVDICSYLKEESSMHEIIYPTIYENFSIIPIKERPENPSELILSARIPQLIQELKKSYDYIIINSTPFGVITDTKHIMKLADINLILFREEYSKKIFVSNLNSMVEQDKVDNIGIIFMQESDIISNLKIL